MQSDFLGACIGMVTILMLSLVASESHLSTSPLGITQKKLLTTLELIYHTHLRVSTQLSLQSVGVRDGKPEISLLRRCLSEMVV